MPSVSLISIAPVKGFALLHPDEVELGPDGVSTNRRFYVGELDGTRRRSSQTDWLSEQAGDAVDGRRFRMLFTLAGCEAHEEDGWNGRLLRVGDAVLRAGGPIERCAVTTRDPDTGERDLDTLRLIRDYRGVSDRQAVDFGVYADVVEPGRVRTGDPVELL